MSSFTFEELSRETHDDVRSLILAGLGDHWGTIDESLNPDLDDMLASYESGRTIVARDVHGAIVGTGTVIPREDGTPEIVRMSVDRAARRTGVGRELVEQLVVIARSWGSEAVVLETTTAWTGVVAFYTSCGFEFTHFAESEFGSETWMVLRLAEQQ